jgi:hypothetical protein
VTELRLKYSCAYFQVLEQRHERETRDLMALHFKQKALRMKQALEALDAERDSKLQALRDEWRQQRQGATTALTNTEKADREKQMAELEAQLQADFQSQLDGLNKQVSFYAVNYTIMSLRLVWHPYALTLSLSFVD